MSNKLKRQMNHLRFMLSMDKNFDFYTYGNNGIFTDKIKLFTASREFIFTKEELKKHIIRTKVNIRKELNK